MIPMSFPSSAARLAAPALILTAVSIGGCGTYSDTAYEPYYDTAPQVTLLPPQVYYYEPAYPGAGNGDRGYYGPGHYGYYNPPNYQD